jgi:hypothetical protein
MLEEEYFSEGVSLYQLRILDTLSKEWAYAREKIPDTL